jgi:hypothetical protein
VRVAREPALPVGRDEASSRLGALLNELFRAIISSGAFLQRSSIGDAMEVDAARSARLRAGDMNRIILKGNARVSMPPLLPAVVGVPVMATLTPGAFTCTFVPSTRDPRLTPLINGLPTFIATTPGVYTFITDGLRWYAGGAL